LPLLATIAWTGVWYGKPDSRIVEQTYPGHDDHLRHSGLACNGLHDRDTSESVESPCFWSSCRNRFRPAENLNLWRERAELNGLPAFILGVRFCNDPWDPVAAASMHPLHFACLWCLPDMIVQSIAPCRG